ncbi:MAG TPA: oxidoreductase [Pseudonocardiaceae bacterium]
MTTTTSTPPTAATPPPTQSSQPARSTRPTLAVWKFTSCDGCQLSLLDCEDELLAVAAQVNIASFTEASSAVRPGPYDISLVEGSISTPEQIEQIKHIRDESKILIAIGACANSGGIQALRNMADLAEFRSIVYARPEYINALDTSTAISDHVPVDYELRGCPINKNQLLEVLGALLVGRKPNLPDTSVCTECKQRGVTCVMVADGTPCLGPVTHAGCGAVCPAYRRGCFGCYGPRGDRNMPELLGLLRVHGMNEDEMRRVFHTFHATFDGFDASGAPVTASANAPAKGLGGSDVRAS